MSEKTTARVDRVKRKPTVDDEAKRQFRTTANSFVTWHQVAYELIGAANLCFRRYRSTRSWFPRPNVLYREEGSGRVFMMLYAMALEDLLKALWVSWRLSFTSVFTLTLRP